MSIPTELKYTKTHEWIKTEANIITVGITHFAQAQLGDLTFVELPAAGDNVDAEQDVAVIESVKAASDIYAPVAGTIEAVNEDLEMSPENINNDPYGDGWIFKINVADPSALEGLLDAAAYSEIAPE